MQENLRRERECLERERQAEQLARQALENKQLAQSYIAIIQQRIKQNWSRPPSARNDMEAVLSIQLIPTGQVIDVALTQSSGNASFDRSVVNAVKKAQRFPELKALPLPVFETNFRQFQLVFRPQDLKQ